MQNAMNNHLSHRVAHKVLSANDLGLTGSHQAGIHVPKPLARSGFFPELDEDMLNPREELQVELPSGRAVAVQFIYYNNRRFSGTRDEYRLTHLTQVLRELGARPGGLLQIAHLGDARYLMQMKLEGVTDFPSTSPKEAPERTVLRLGGGWVLINF